MKFRKCETVQDLMEVLSELPPDLQLCGGFGDGVIPIWYNKKDADGGSLGFADPDDYDEEE